jgi:lipopolysaccharide biosynthesis glycosyltransferase
MLRSLDANYHGQEKLEVYVFVPEKQKDWDFYNTKFENLSVNVLYHPIFDTDEAVAASGRMLEKSRLTEASTYRFYAAHLLRSYSKAIYIDSDTIICRDIQPLLDFQPIGAIAAFQEGQVNLEDNPSFKDAAYFNSGVMVINMPYWRAQRVHEKAIKLAKTFEDWTGSTDQDVLNVLFRNNWTPLPMAFNYLVNLFPDVELKDPLVVHWAGKKKPWLSSSKNDTWKQTWKYYKNLSPTTM